MVNVYKKALNKAAAKGTVLKEMSKEDSLALKKCLLDIYQAISAICEAHHLTVMLGGGSCLGAVRHKGFIPWDDDLDLLMPRNDYERFIQLCEEGDLGEELFISYPNHGIDSETMFVKVFMKGTKMKGIGESPYPKECFVDIFPLEGMSKYKTVRTLKGLLANTVRLIANTVAESKQVSLADESFYSSTLSLQIIRFIRKVIGHCFSVVDHKTWVCWYNSIVSNGHMEGMVGIPTGRKLYDGETFPANVFFPPTTGTFEGLEVLLPADVDSYLKNLYHNYMELPPIEERERHIFTDFKVPQKYYV